MIYDMSMSISLLYINIFVCVCAWLRACVIECTDRQTDVRTDGHRESDGRKVGQAKILIFIDIED